MLDYNADNVFTVYTNKENWGNILLIKYIQVRNYLKYVF